jgi:hypothetical protein
LAISSAVLAQTVRVPRNSPEDRRPRPPSPDSEHRWRQAVDFETFSKILNRPGGFREPFDIEEYIRGFQVFDKDRSGFVGKGQIKYILTNLGEKMSEEEVDELFKSTIDASNNEVDYRGMSATATGVPLRGTVLRIWAGLTQIQSSWRRLPRTRVPALIFSLLDSHSSYHDLGMYETGHGFGASMHGVGIVYGCDWSYSSHQTNEEYMIWNNLHLNLCDKHMIYC